MGPWAHGPQVMPGLQADEAVEAAEAPTEPDAEMQLAVPAAQPVLPIQAVQAAAPAAQAEHKFKYL